MLKGKKVALFVTGGIAVYKAVELLRVLIKNGAEVKVAMTESACRFVTPLTFQILSKNKVYTDLFEESDYEEVSHIHLSDWSDIRLVAPATANIMAKLAHGLADDFVSASLLAGTSPLILIPAMNSHMWENEATCSNRKILEKRGIFIMEPEEGFLAEGYEGKGRFPSIENIEAALVDFLETSRKFGKLHGKKVLVTAGGTKERLDPVRFLTNESSGKMGHAIAEAAYQEGGEIFLITASSLPVPAGVKAIRVQSAQEMEKAVFSLYKKSEIVIMAAAVSDYRPIEPSEQKIKKNESLLTLKFEKTPDILKHLGEEKEGQYLVGFAAETEKLEEYAKKKLKEKNLDLIAANDVSKKESGFNVDFNELMLITKEGSSTFIPLTEKKDAAKKMIDFIAQQLIEE